MVFFSSPVRPLYLHVRGVQRYGFLSNPKNRFRLLKTTTAFIIPLLQIHCASPCVPVVYPSADEKDIGRQPAFACPNPAAFELEASFRVLVRLSERWFPSDYKALGPARSFPGFLKGFATTSNSEKSFLSPLMYLIWQ